MWMEVLGCTLIVGRESNVFASLALETVLLNSALGSALLLITYLQGEKIAPQIKRFFFPLGTRLSSAALSKIHHFVAQIHRKGGRKHPDPSSLTTSFIFWKLDEKTNGIL